jgi:hypothetical protein
VWQTSFVHEHSEASSAVVPGLAAIVDFQKSHGAHPFVPFVGLSAKAPHADTMGRADAGASQASDTLANEIILPATPARADLLLLGQNNALVRVTVHGATIMMRDVFALPATIVRSPANSSIPNIDSIRT